MLVALGAEAKNLSFFGDAGIERSRALLAEVRALANRLDTPAARGVALDAEGHVALMSARWSDALRINREAEATFRDHCPGAHHDVFDAMALQAAALYALGDMRGLARVCGRSARGAARRNDLYHETMARLFLAAPVALARDDVDGARREIEAQREVARHHERMQIAAVMLLHVRIAHALYARRVEADREELDLAHRALRTNPLLRASFTRADVFSYRGRLVLGSAEESPARRAAALDEARRLAHDLIGQPFASAAPQGRMLLAGAAFLAGDRAAAAASLRHAIDAFDALEMALWAAAARLRLGELLGGDDGTAMRAGAGEAMAELGVVDADAFARVLAPGFEA